MKTTITRTLLLFATVFTFGYTLLDRADMTGEVFVSFVINTEGRIEVLECNSANERLKSYVLRKLARIDIGDNPEGSWKTTHMRFNFHREKA